MPAPAVHASGRQGWRPPLMLFLVIAGAFALGLLLFLLVWMRGRQHDDFYRAQVLPTSEAPVFAPLPAPMPGGNAEAGASGLPEPDEKALAERPRIVERQPPPPVAAAQASAPPAPAMAASQPVPVSSPAPRYPTGALRRRETGTVRVRVDVGTDGTPVATTVVESSQSRDLDRAAVEAVRRWRFRPAEAGGRPVPGSVVVPIDFRL